MEVKIGIRFHRAEITYFEINRLYAYIKQIICEGIEFWQKFKYETDYIPKTAQLERKYFYFFIPHVGMLYHPWIAAFEGRSLTKQEHQDHCPILLAFRHFSPPLCKENEKPEVDK